MGGSNPPRRINFPGSFFWGLFIVKASFLAWILRVNLLSLRRLNILKIPKDLTDTGSYLDSVILIKPAVIIKPVYSIRRCNYYADGNIATRKPGLT